MRATKVEGGRQAAIDALRNEGLDVTEWDDDAGVVYEEHAHPFAETRVVLSGSMTMIVAGESHDLGPGDRIDLEPGERHAAAIGPHGVHYLAGTDR